MGYEYGMLKWDAKVVYENGIRKCDNNRKWDTKMGYESEIGYENGIRK